MRDWMKKGQITLFNLSASSTNLKNSNQHSNKYLVISTIPILEHMKLSTNIAICYPYFKGIKEKDKAPDTVQL
jgi:hypothetical protein